MTEAPSPFSKNIPNFQTSYDSTSLGWLKTCPKFYQYQMLLNYAPKSKGIHLAFGAWYASGVELYAKERAKGASHDAAALTMVKRAMCASGELTTDHEPTCDVLSNEGGTCSCEGPEVFVPWESGDPNKNRYTLIRSLLWNVDERNENPIWQTVILTNGKPAVELSFNFKAFELDGEDIYLSGHMDELVTNAGQVFVKDDKTTKSPLDASYFKHYTPDNQMSLYTIAGKVILNAPVAGVLVRAAQILVNSTRFATMPIPRPPAVLAEWLDDTKHYIRLAREYAIAGHWPMNDKACGNYGGCPFQRVCAVSPSHRKAWLEAEFTNFVWNPLEAR